MPIFENFSLYALLMDLFYASLFLIVAQLLRKKIKLLQNLYIPASLLGGLMGMLCGSEFLNIIPYSTQVGSYATVLVIPLFASLALGYTGKREDNVFHAVAKVKDTFFAFFAAHVLQFGIGITAGYFLCKTLFPGVNETIGILMPAGFAGGHGFATSIGSTLETNYGFNGAVGIGVTFATIGLLVGIVGGMININIATRLGSTRFTKNINEVPREMRTGWIPEGQRSSLGEATMNASSIDPQGWHWCVVFLVSGFAYLVNYWIKQAAGIDIPYLCLAAILGVLTQTILNSCGIGHYVNKLAVQHVGGTVTDFLVFFGFVSIKKSIIIEYAGPLVILCLIGIVWTTFQLWILGPMWYNSYWFERSIFIYGMLCGVMATGVTLLRVVDPEYKSHTLEDYSIAYIILSWQSTFMVTMFPIFCGTGHTLLTGLGAIGAGLLTIVIAYVCKAFHPWKKEYLNAEKFEEAMGAKMS